MKSYIYGAVLIATSAFPAVAQDAAIAVEMSVFEVVTSIDDDGKEIKQRVASDNLVPQDVVVISATLSNMTDEALSDITFKLDVDPSLSLIEDGIMEYDATGYTFSTRQKPAHFAALDDLTVPSEDGAERAATADDIGAIQVNLAEIGAAKNAVFEYSATIR
jgi:hypothetical protein